MGIDRLTIRWLVIIFLVWCLIAILLALPRISNPLFGLQGDLPTHYHINRSYAMSFEQNDILPRWAGLLDGGRGDALFTFYPPLSYLLSALLVKLLGVGILDGLKILYVLIFLFAQASAYAFARSCYPRARSLLVSTIYVLLPAYPLIALHRNLLANAFALSLVPLVLLGVKWILVGREWDRGLMIFLISFSAVVLTHAITTYLCLLAIGLMTLCLLPESGWRGIFRLFGAGLVAGLLTAFFVVPQILELGWTQVGLQTEFQNFRNYFLFARPADGTPYRTAWAMFNTFFSLVIILQTLLGGLLALIYKWGAASGAISQRDKFPIQFGLALVAFGFAISLPISEPVWHYLPGLKFIQFPWRFQPLTALGCGLMAGMIKDVWHQIGSGRRMVFTGFLTALSITGIYFTWASISLDASDKNGKTGIDVASYLQPTGIRPLSFDEWRKLLNDDNEKYALYAANQIYFRPRQTDLILYPPVSQIGGITILKGKGHAISQKLEVAHREFEFENEEPVEVRVETYNYPHWVALLDEREIEITPEHGSGLMLLQIPAGRHKLRLDFEVRLKSELTTRYVSLISWVLFLLWSVMRWANWNHAASNPVNNYQAS